MWQVAPVPVEGAQAGTQIRRTMWKIPPDSYFTDGATTPPHQKTEGLFSAKGKQKVSGLQRARYSKKQKKIHESLECRESQSSSSVPREVVSSGAKNTGQPPHSDYLSADLPVPGPWLLFATVEDVCSSELLMTLRPAFPKGKLRQTDPRQNCIKSIWERNTHHLFQYNGFSSKNKCISPLKQVLFYVLSKAE